MKNNIDGNNKFLTTCWTEIIAARTLDPQRRNNTISTIIKRYWKPAYFYLLRLGINEEDAKDITQKFFTEHVIEKNFLYKAEKTKGRFRSFLSTSLYNFFKSEYRKKKTQDRRPSGGFISIDAFDAPDFLFPAEIKDPDQAFSYTLVSQLLDETLTEVKDYYLKKGKEKHWEVFRLIVIKPLLYDAEKPSHEIVCKKLGLKKGESEDRLGNVKRRFKNVLWNKISQSVSSEDEIDSEISDLKNILLKKT